MTATRWCPACRRMREVTETFEEGTTERRPERYIVSVLACGHSAVALAADQADRGLSA